jgi:glycerate kinase
VGWLDAATGVIESRLVCGLSLLSYAERNPMLATTRGLGELISQVVADGARQLYVGLGGSATMDGGVGMARAWGWTPRGVGGEPLPEGGGALAALERIDRGSRPAAELIALADVRNPLTGPAGARIYAAQKGADSAAEECLAQGVDRLVEATQDLGSKELALRDGAGAAGGLGFGLTLFGGGGLVPGAGWVLDRLRFAEVLAGAVGVLTGEGAFDATSLQGKLTGEVLQRAARAGVPTGLLAPSAESVPDGTVVESGGGQWDAGELERRASRAVRRLLRLPLA